MKLVRPIKICLNETYKRVINDKHLYYVFPLQNGLLQEGALSVFLLNFASEYSIMKVRGNQMILELNETFHRFVYADDIDLLAKKFHKGETQALERLGLSSRYSRIN
jgi:hypothetical protein